MQFYVTVPSHITRMMIGLNGKYKNGVVSECEVSIDVVPISDSVGAMWTIIGEEANIKKSLQYLNSIFQNTIIKNRKSNEVSPFLAKNVKRKPLNLNRSIEDMQAIRSWDKEKKTWRRRWDGDKSIKSSNKS